MLKHIVRYGAPVDVEGSFSCVYSDGKELYIFRNELESMFIDEDMTFCTSPFKDCKATPSNKMFRLDLEKKKMKLIEEFITVKHWC